MTGAEEHPVVATFLQLVGIPSPSGGERKIVDAVAERLRMLGATVEEDDAATTIGGDAGNLVARLAPTVVGEPLLLCAHLDTVDPGDEVRPAVRDGIVIAERGRVLGADDKAAIAAALDALRRIRDEGVDHAGIEILFTVQEERGLAGVRVAHLDALRSHLAVIVDDSGPIGGVVMGAPGYLHVTLLVEGRAAHASEPQLGANAILAAAAGLAALPASPDGVTTNVGFIRGGSGLNVVADRAEVELEVRGLHHDAVIRHLEAIVAAMQAAADHAGCRLATRTDTLYRAYAHEEDDAAVLLAHEALRAVGSEPVGITATGGSDANALIAAGIDTVTLTGGMLDMHTSAERIAVSDLIRLSDLIVALVRARAAGGRPS